jgi:hypothetical protein
MSLGATYEVTEQPWWSTSDRSMPPLTAAGGARRHFAAESAGVLEPRDGAANVLVCRDTDADEAFRLFMATLTSPVDAASAGGAP